MEKLGQHFLINQAAIHKIIAALELKINETIIEIGPGRGALTMPLIEKCRSLACKIIAIEKDQRLANELTNKLVNKESLIEVVRGDALKLLPNLIINYQPQDTNYKIVGNIPYYITGILLRVLSELNPKPRKIVLTIQREVAQRLVAKPPKMNLLAAITQFWSQPEIINYLKPTDFEPPPKVTSAIILLTPNHDFGADPQNYYAFAKILFKQPRKTILNNLKSGTVKKPETILELLKKYGLTGHERPQNLSLAQIKGLSSDWPKFTKT